MARRGGSAIRRLSAWLPPVIEHSQGGRVELRCGCEKRRVVETARRAERGGIWDRIDCLNLTGG